MFKKVRKLRVTVCGKRTKRGSDAGQKRAAPQSDGGGGSGSGSGSGGGSGGGSGEGGDRPPPKKEKKVPAFKVNRDNAKKRINLKSANTRNKVTEGPVEPII